MRKREALKSLLFGCSKSYLPFLRLHISMTASDGAEMRWQPPDPPKNKHGYPEDLIREEEEDETRGIMKLAESNLAELLNSEPDIYTLKDLKID